ncbi:MAG: GspH/FimT family pseudopilin [Candidatus Hydrogenedentes bacterium]|nr:GspH/FimT family pseudopilin [Candidatus Hydrogenedentota bacterium]
MPTTPRTTICKPSPGFTLLELVITLLILGIVAAMAVPLLASSLNESKLDGATSAVTTALEYARLKAMSNGRNFQVVFDTTNEDLTVEEYQYDHLSQLQNPSQTQLQGDWVDFASSYGNAPDPLDPDSLNDYIVSFKTEQAYLGTDLLSASFGGSDTITFDTVGTPSAGGTAVVQLGGLQRTITVNATTGQVSTS